MAASVAFFDPGFQGNETAALLEGMAKRCGLRLREGCECQIPHRFFRKICKRSPTYASYE